MIYKFDFASTPPKQKTSVRRHIHGVVYNNQDLYTTKYPKTDKWIKKLRHVYKMKYHATIKNNELLSFEKYHG